MKIMLVEDDGIIRESLASTLENWGYQVFALQEFDHILEDFAEISPHLILLDLVLPSQNGYYWCQEIRKHSNLPIIFISSKNENMDMVMAMQFGADDYVTKPFDLQVLVAKIQALLRRSYEFSLEKRAGLIFANVELDPEAMKLISGEQEVELTKTERNLLKVLFEGQGKVISREKLMESCWLFDDYIDDNTLAVNMTRLRKKMKSLGSPDLIKTVRGVGYALQESSDA